MLRSSENDVRGPIIVIDLEWVGNTAIPSTTHVVQLACRNILTQETYACHVQAIAAQPGLATKAIAPRDAYTGWLAWMTSQRDSAQEACLVAHNGIRYDAPVLLCNLLRHGMQVPDWIVMMDSLHHIRHQTRYWKEHRPGRYDIDSMCTYCNIKVDQTKRHDARYDVDLLCSILMTMHNTKNVPIISGAWQPVNVLSTMLVRGVGPVIWQSLPSTGLLNLCQEIINVHGDLTEQSCANYLEQNDLKLRVPLCNVDMIACSVASAAKAHLQYLE